MTEAELLSRVELRRQMEIPQLIFGFNQTLNVESPMLQVY